MSRLRADLHSSLTNSPYLKEVRERISKLPQEELLAKLGMSGGSVKNELEEGQDSARWEYIGEESIKTLEQALSFCQVDLDKWEVERHLFNSWDVTSKDFGKRTNYQVKVWFKIRETNLSEIYQKLTAQLGKKIKPQRTGGSGVGIVSIADLHAGADIQNLKRTKDFDINILRKYLHKAADKVNTHGYNKVYINILGDLVETISGLNHPNSWKSIGKDMHGYKIIILIYEMLRDDFILRIENVEEINIVPGNHDRFTPSNKIDSVGELGGLMAYMLRENLKVTVNYDDLVVTRVIDGINYIMLHAQHSMAKNDIKLVADYGRSNMFNVILKAHRHTRTKKQTKRVEYRDQDYINIDDLNYRALTIAPLFTGNFYSESLGFTSTAGASVIENNGEGKINVMDYTL